MRATSLLYHSAKHLILTELGCAGFYSIILPNDTVALHLQKKKLKSKIYYLKNIIFHCNAEQNPLVYAGRLPV